MDNIKDTELQFLSSLISLCKGVRAGESAESAEVAAKWERIFKQHQAALIRLGRHHHRKHQLAA